MPSKVLTRDDNTVFTATFAAIFAAICQKKINSNDTSSPTTRFIRFIRPRFQSFSGSQLFRLSYFVQFPPCSRGFARRFRRTHGLRVATGNARRSCP
jgi:hypothetical protein